MTSTQESSGRAGRAARKRVVERTDRYWVAGKTGDAAAVAKQLGPRSEGRAAGD